MSGRLLVNALLHEVGHPVNPAEGERLRQYHAEAYKRAAGRTVPDAARLEALGESSR